MREALPTWVETINGFYVAVDKDMHETEVGTPQGERDHLHGAPRLKKREPHQDPDSIRRRRDEVTGSYLHGPRDCTPQRVRGHDRHPSEGDGRLDMVLHFKGLPLAGRSQIPKQGKGALLRSALGTGPCGRLDVPHRKGIHDQIPAEPHP